MYIIDIIVNTNSFWQMVGVIAQIFFVIIAFLSLYYAVWGDRKIFAPDLTIEFDEHDESLCHKTTIKTTISPIFFDTYYFRFYVENKGKSMAKRCEIVAEKLWTKNPEEQYYRSYEQFAPMNLNWTEREAGIIDINPKRKVVGNIGYIPEMRNQDLIRDGRIWPGFLKDIDIIGKERSEKERFILDLVRPLHALPNCLTQGDYYIQIGLYSENAKDKKMYLEIIWKGDWTGEKKDMFERIKIARKETPPD